MQFSGYDKKFRFEVVRSAMEAYKRIKALDQEGVRPMYKDKGLKKKCRKRKGGKEKGMV